MSAPSDWQREYERREREREQHGGRLLAFALPALRFLGVEQVEIPYDGFGDDGEVQPARLTPEPAGGLPEGLPSLLERVCDHLLPGAWEINEGSFGTLRIDVRAGTHQLDHTWREEEEEEFAEEEDDPE